MPDSVALKYLLDKKLLNLPIVISLIMLYHETNLNFVNYLVSLYFSEQSVFQDKEIDELITQVIMVIFIDIDAYDLNLLLDLRNDWWSCLWV